MWTDKKNNFSWTSTPFNPEGNRNSDNGRRGIDEDGSKKLSPLMIGCSEKPKCFSKIKSFAYKVNKKSDKQNP